MRSATGHFLCYTAISAVAKETGMATKAKHLRVVERSAIPPGLISFADEVIE
jgi:hypothetical protein